MYIILKDQPADKVGDILGALRQQTSNVVRITSHSEAQKRLLTLNDNIERLNNGKEVDDILYVYPRTWNYYISSEKTMKFKTYATEHLAKSAMIEKALDSESNELRILDVVFVYIENYGAAKGTITSMTDKGIKLQINNEREFYVLKAHGYRLLKV